MYPTTECPYCRQSIRNCNLDKHIQRHVSNPQSFKPAVHKVTHEGLDCCFCGKTCKNLNSLTNHERLCRSNPDGAIQKSNLKQYHSKLANGEISVWNRGLTKESDPRVASQAESQKEYYSMNPSGFTGKHHSDESKRKIALAQLLVDHDTHNRFSHGKRGYLDGMFFMSTWELAYYIYMRDHGHIIVRCPYKFDYVYEEKEHKYTPDFLVDNELIVEVKGWETDLDKLKYTLVDNLQVLYYNDIKEYIQYVENHYNTKNLTTLYDVFIDKS